MQNVATLQIRQMDVAQAQQLYQERMVKDFPPAELKPFSSVEGMMRQNIYEPLGIYHKETLQAYAWLTVLPECRCALLDYFAAMPQLRGKGTGTQALKALQEYYAPRKAALLIECEHPGEAPDRTEAKRRVSFYLRAGARPAAMESRVFGVRYQIYALPCGQNPGDTQLHKDLETIYRRMVPEPYYRGNVLFFGM